MCASVNFLFGTNAAMYIFFNAINNSDFTIFGFNHKLFCFVLKF